MCVCVCVCVCVFAQVSLWSGTLELNAPILWIKPEPCQSNQVTVLSIVPICLVWSMSGCIRLPIIDVTTIPFEPNHVPTKANPERETESRLLERISCLRRFHYIWQVCWWQKSPILDAKAYLTSESVYDHFESINECNDNLMYTSTRSHKVMIHIYQKFETPIKTQKLHCIGHSPSGTCTCIWNFMT